MDQFYYHMAGQKWVKVYTKMIQVAARALDIDSKYIHIAETATDRVIIDTNNFGNLKLRNPDKLICKFFISFRFQIQVQQQHLLDLI